MIELKMSDIKFIYNGAPVTITALKSLKIINNKVYLTSEDMQTLKTLKRLSKGA